VEQAALNHHDEIVELEPYNASGESVKSGTRNIFHLPAYIVHYAVENYRFSVTNEKNNIKMSKLSETLWL
jgi:hypothetical protein